MRRLSGFVHQDDIFYGTLTVLEHLNILAHLKLDRRIGKNEIQFIIRDVLERTGLLKCANTRIGEDGEGKVMSGGEKKRLAFATELLTQPAILFCDEPTTGLNNCESHLKLHNLIFHRSRFVQRSENCGNIAGISSKEKYSHFVYYTPFFKY